MTGPPVKKRKADPGGNASVVRGETESLIAKFTTMLDAMEEESDPSNSNSSQQLFMDASATMLSLKSLQRQILDQIDATQRTLAEQKQRRDAQELKLENLKYQKQLHEHSIHTCQKLQTPQLKKLCHSEVNEKKGSGQNEDNRTNDEKNKNTITEEDTDALLQSFLGADPKDALQRGVIVAKLNDQIETRRRLEKELKHSEQKAANLKQLVTSKRKLLNELPMKLAEMERASLPLQSFCQKAMGASKLLGTERRKHLDLSQCLPKPLYTLFYQLRSSLDNMELSGELAASEIEDAPSLEVNKDATMVLLTFQIPHVTDRSNMVTSGFGSGKKNVIVSFEYHSTLDVVTTCCSKDHDMGNFLGELFPEDLGEWTDHAHDEDETGEKEVTTNLIPSLEKAGKRPYNWCNYLSGLHMPLHGNVSREKVRISSVIVIKAILRRVRAHATLHWILNALSRKPNPLPVHPSLKDLLLRKDSGVRLATWSEQPTSSVSESSSCQEQVFVASLKRKSATLSLRVRIRPARYPSVPPTWEFNPDTQHCNSESSLVENDNPLYDDALVGIERQVNQDVEGLVLSTNETTYDWILSHQLSQIAIKWDEYLAGKTAQKCSS